MDRFIATPRAAIQASFVLSVVLLTLMLVVLRADALSALAISVRVIHVFAAMIWVGLVIFVNVVQLELAASAAAPERAFLMGSVAPRVATLYRHASTVTVAAGAVLLLTSGYVLPVLIYGTAVELGAVRGWAMALGTLGALAMWMFVHMFIWPALQVVTGMRAGDDVAKTAARGKVKRYARLNLILALPVTLLMIAAAHGG